MMNRVLLLTLVFLLGLTWSCGHSEDEWQAQLARYADLEGQHASERREHAKTADELELARKVVVELKAQLERMGVNVDELNRQLQEEGTAKDQMAADLAEMRLALDEYKKRATKLERIRQRFEVLREKLQKLTRLGLKVEIRHNRMVISLPGDVLFASGQDELRQEGIAVLASVAEVIRGDEQLSQRYFQVAGHTDNKPLRAGTRFRDNWGLSAMRGRQVLVYLISAVDEQAGGGGLSATRLHAAGYGDTDPIATNETAEGRQANRRVELVLMPDVSEMLDLKSLI